MTTVRKSRRDVPRGLVRGKKLAETLADVARIAAGMREMDDMLRPKAELDAAVRQALPRLLLWQDDAARECLEVYDTAERAAKVAGAEPPLVDFSEGLRDPRLMVLDLTKARMAVDAVALTGVGCADFNRRFFYAGAFAPDRDEVAEVTDWWSAVRREARAAEPR